MHQPKTAAARREGRAAGERAESSAGLVLAAGLLMVAAHVAYRGWVVYEGYFFADDYALLYQAQDASLTSEYLLDPTGHLMPAGRLIIWLVSHEGTLSWPLAATFTMVLQLLVALAALAMCFTLFGLRWATLAPLAVYLTTALTLPAFVWWISALLLLPTQLAFFWAVAAWIRYLRGRQLRWALVAYAGVAFALLFDVKGLIVLPVLAYLALAYFAEGSLLRRVREVLRTYWAAAAIGLPVLGAYLAYFVYQGEQPIVMPGWGLTARLVDIVLGEAFPTAVLGGPWRWDYGVQPTSVADPPGWSVHLAWVLLAGIAAYGWLRRTRTLRAWGLVALVLAIDVVLLLVTRAGPFGADVGREYRFLAEVAPAVALGLGLAFLGVPGATQSSTARETPLLTLGASVRMVVPLVAVVSALGMLSQTLYARQWHAGNASESYVKTLRSELATHGAVDLVDQAVPEAVIQWLVTPYNRVEVLVSLVSDAASFPRATSRLVMVGEDGTLRRAVLTPVTTSPPGPLEGCGWLVGAQGRDIPLAAPSGESTWWVRIGYLASQTTNVSVQAGGQLVAGPVEEGLGELWVRVDGSIDRVRIGGLDGGATMCVDTVQVGQPEPGGFL